MSQDDVLILLFKIVLVAGVLSVLLFAVRYHQMTRGGVWRNEIGRTIIVKDVLLILMLLPSILSLFLKFNRLTSHVAAWIDVVLFGLLTPVMLWRAAVWGRVHRGKELTEDSPEPPGAHPGS